MTSNLDSPTPDHGSMRGKSVVISGGASGIGAACADVLAARGAQVLIGYYPADPYDPSAVVDRIRAAGGRAEHCELDVSNDISIQSFVATATRHFGRLDYVVAAAGILRKAALSEIDDQEWERVLSVDLGGVHRLFRQAAAVMEVGGSLVSISSISGAIYGWAQHAHYCAAKAGLLGLTRATAMELAPRGIRANTLIPGVITTPQSLDPHNSLGPDGLAEAAKSIPLQRVGIPEEIARVAAFLLSDDASYITAQEIVVDGGLTRVQS
ncbi:MAG: SDR family NAD(P)-dependent oxidoreductase [Mycobacterium sp.]